ncbi:MAG: hypothetical protein LC623_06690 [Halobacteriales archaeon]|nr:hypothetical protein [Halobacteriales archaeon]
MHGTLLRFACLASACLATLVVAPGAAAGSCPFGTTQTFSGTLLPGETDAIRIGIALRANTTFQFVPANPFWGQLGQTVSMTVAGNSMTGTGSLAITLVQASPGIYTVQLRGHFLAMDGMAALPYQLMVSQRDCQAP